MKRSVILVTGLAILAGLGLFGLSDTVTSVAEELAVL